MSILSFLSLHFMVAYCIAIKYEPHLLISNSSQQINPSISSPENFSQVVFASNVFVDKSLLIKDIIEDGGKLYLITCPPRWGKSINMLMMKSFFEIQFEKCIHLRPKSSGPNYRLFVNGEEFVDGKKLQSPFLISRHKEIIDKHLGQYPLIYVDFASSRINYTDMKDCIASKVRPLFKQYAATKQIYQSKMNKSDRIEREEADQQFNLFTKFENHNTELTTLEVINSLKFLSKCMKEYYKYYPDYGGNKVIILMDGYSTLWEHIVQDESRTDEQKIEFMEFFRNFISETFTTNDYLHLGIITGVLPPFAELRESLPDAIECNLLNGKFMKYYSFNQWDVESLLNHTKASEIMKREIDRYYKGYKTNTRNLRIYNAKSIMKFLNKRQTQPFKINRRRYGYIVRNFLNMNLIKKKLKLLKRGKFVTVKLNNTNINWKEYEILTSSAFNRTVDGDVELSGKLCLLMHATGYFTSAKDHKWNVFRLRFPNKQIIFSINSQFRSTNRKLY